MTVFRVLFPHWSSFCEFRKSLSDEKLTTTLERQRRKKLERMKQQMKEQEKEEARRVQAKILYCWTVYCREKESRHNVFRSFIRITTNKIIYNLIDKDELQRYEY